MQKAIGWMLREVGKRDEATLVSFLNEFATKMPRTTLRYAIEKFSPERRKEKQGNQLATNCSQLKMVAADGKRYLTDCLPQSDMLQLVVITFVSLNRKKNTMAIKNMRSIIVRTHEIT